jgi:Raf kinase inhibitor-like YbhB/YbcL family protein
MKKIMLLLFLLFYHLSGAAHMKLISSAFSAQSAIPSVYTCEGSDISPALTWSDIPSNAKSLVLIVEDPDAPDPKAPKMTWVHWVLYNIPTDSNGLPENVATDQLPKGTLVGLNSQPKPHYQGPCPPIGVHRYFFKLYALDSVLPDLNHPTADSLRSAMHGKIIAETELMGTYIKQGT